MGSTTWKGETLYSGFNLFIGGKEVELDSKVESAQLPKLSGMSRDPVDDEMDVTGPNETTYVSSMDFKSPRPSVLPETAKFVAPTSFYGAPVKSKPQGPLCV